MLDIRSVSDPGPYLAVPGFELSPEQLARQRPDERLLVWDGDRVVARCGLWFRQPGVVGHYFAASAPAGEAILAAACARLAAEGCAQAVGPMDGSTWERYRLVTERGDEPPFFLEPDNPDDWPAHFLAAGFAPLAGYASALAEGLDTADLSEWEDITIRTLDPARFDDELRKLHALSLLCFADNFLYTPIDEADFLSLYAPARAFIRPDLVLLAEKDGALVGFIFGVPDLLQARRGVPIDTVVVKTMAVHPDHAGRGLGGHLMALMHRAVQRAGYRRAIHALYHDDNRSGRISRHTARVIRRYTLYARPLGAAP